MRKASPVPRTERPFLAILIRIAATMCVATLMALVKLASARGIALPELLFWRQALTIPVILMALAMSGQLHRLRTRTPQEPRLSRHNQLYWHDFGLLRNDPAELAAGERTLVYQPLFRGSVHGADPARTCRSLALVGRCNRLCRRAADRPAPAAEHLNPLGAAAGLVAAVVVVVISYQVKDLARTDDAIACVFYLALFASLYLAALMPFFARSHTREEWLLLAAIGTAGMLGQYLMTVSLMYGAIATVLIMDYALLLWTTLLSVMIWNQWPHPATWYGAPLIILAGLIITWRAHRLSREASPISASELD